MLIMPRRPPPGRCIHCLKQFDQLTWDHVLPDSWYPELADNHEKWQAPSCEFCNNELGKLEENLLTKFGLCLDPLDKNSQGIPEKVIRSLNPEVGRNERDKEFRQKRRKKTQNETRVLEEPPSQNIFPNFGPLPNVIYQEYPTIEINPEDLEKFARKVVRGIAYIADKSFIEDNYEIEIFFLENDKAEGMKKFVDTNSEVFDRKPGLLAKRRLVENDPVGGIYYIEIWYRFIFFAVVAPKDLNL